MSFYDKVYKVLKGPVKWIFGLTVEGQENVPENGGYLVCANHASIADVFVLVIATGKQIKFMAKKEICNTPIVGSLIQKCGAYPVNRGTADISAIKHTVELLKAGEFVGMFPQGTRHPYENPRETEVKNGVGLVSYRSGCGVLPIYIKTKDNKPRWFHKTHLIIGKPIENSELGFTNGSRHEYTAAAETIFDIICDLGENS